MPKKENALNGKESVERDENGRFRKGTKVPGQGRKAIPNDVKKMFTEAVPEAVNLLISVMKDEGKEDKLRVQCAETIIERVYGKNPQPIITDGESILRVIFGDGKENIEDFSK